MDKERFETLKENVRRSYNEGLVTVRALERGKYLDYYIVPTVDSLNYLLKKHYGINEAIIKLCLRKNAVISLPEIRAYLLSESVIPTDEFKELLLESDETKKQEHYKQLAFKALELVGVKPKTTYVCFSDIFTKGKEMNLEQEMFKDTVEQRGIPFATIGMRVELQGKRGTIKGVNSSANLDVLFDGEKHKSNCHPTWEMIYFNGNGSICKDFREIKTDR